MLIKNIIGFLAFQHNWNEWGSCNRVNRRAPHKGRYGKSASIFDELVTCIGNIKQSNTTELKIRIALIVMIFIPKKQIQKMLQPFMLPPLLNSFRYQYTKKMLIQLDWLTNFYIYHDLKDQNTHYLQKMNPLIYVLELKLH